jgi:enamine deaminase RidA (YjgF/YER057c/UK114 family)
VNLPRFAAVLVLLGIALSAIAQPPPLQPSNRTKKKSEDKEPITQTLPVLKDPPGAVIGETNKLVFHVSPLSGKGLLTPQTRDALNTLMKLNRGAQIAKLRAFVAGTGDMRRVQTIVSEVFTDKKLPLPALSTLQVGGLPMEGAQVVIESVSVDKKPAHANGLVFLSGQKAGSAPLAMSELDAVAKASGVGSILKVTCFVSSFEGIQSLRDGATHLFPAAALNFVQALRASPDSSVVCEGVGDRAQAGDPVQSTAGGVLVGTPKLVFSGTQLAFREQDTDLRLAFQRLQKALEPLGVSYQDVIFSNTYALTRAVSDGASRVGAEFFSRQPIPVGTKLIVEGLPSLDASMAVEVIAALRN